MAGRPKKKITKNDLYNYLYTYKKVLWSVPTYKCEDELFEVLSNANIKDMDKSKFEEFINIHLDLINKFKYKSNERCKNHEIIKYIKSIPEEKLTINEKQILDFDKGWFALTRDEYFQLQKLLNNYRSNNLNQIKNTVAQNTQSSEDKADKQEKNKERKKMNHEKFFLGGAFLSLYKELVNNEHIHPTNALIEMIKLYAIHQFNAQHEHDITELFARYIHIPPFTELNEKLTKIALDPRNPVNQKVSS